MELSSDELHIEEFFLLFGCVRAEVLAVCHVLVEVSSNTVQNEVDKVVVSHVGIDIESIDIIQVFLDGTCLR